MSARTDALVALRDRIKNEIATVSPKGVWVHPADSASFNFATMPVVLVQEAIGVEGTWGAHSYGTGQDRWMAWIIAFTHKFGSDMVAAETVEFATPFGTINNWRKVMADCLYGDMTLAGNATDIGYGDGRLFTYTADYLQWQKEIYFGILFELPIRQTFTQAVSA